MALAVVKTTAVVIANHAARQTAHEKIQAPKAKQEKQMPQVTQIEAAKSCVALQLPLQICLAICVSSTWDNNFQQPYPTNSAAKTKLPDPFLHHRSPTQAYNCPAGQYGCSQLKHALTIRSHTASIHMRTPSQREHVAAATIARQQLSCLLHRKTDCNMALAVVKTTAVVIANHAARQTAHEKT